MGGTLRVHPDDESSMFALLPREDAAWVVETAADAVGRSTNECRPASPAAAFAASVLSATRPARPATARAFAGALRAVVGDGA